MTIKAERVDFKEAVERALSSIKFDRDTFHPWTTIQVAFGFRHGSYEFAACRTKLIKRLSMPPYSVTAVCRMKEEPGGGLSILSSSKAVTKFPAQQNRKTRRAIRRANTAIIGELTSAAASLSDFERANAARLVAHNETQLSRSREADRLNALVSRPSQAMERRVVA